VKKDILKSPTRLYEQSTLKCRSTTHLFPFFQSPAVRMPTDIWHLQRCVSLHLPTQGWPGWVGPSGMVAGMVDPPKVVTVLTKLGVMWASLMWRTPLPLRQTSHLLYFVSFRFYITTNSVACPCNVIHDNVTLISALLIIIIITIIIRVHYGKNFNIYFCKFWANMGFPLVNKINK